MQESIEVKPESKYLSDLDKCSASTSQSVPITDYDNLASIPTLGKYSMFLASPHIDRLDHKHVIFCMAEIKVGSETDMAELQKNIQSLVNYNDILRENLIATQSKLQHLASKSQSSD